jgi:hypothetical protein
MSNLISAHIIFVLMRVDIVDNLYSSKPAIATPSQSQSQSQSQSESQSESQSPSPTQPKAKAKAKAKPNTETSANGSEIANSSLRKNCRIVEDCESLRIWRKMRHIFEGQLSTNLDSNSLIILARKTYAMYLLALRWILVHSNKDRKFRVDDYSVLMQDMIGMSKFWKTYLSAEIINEIRVLSQIDVIFELMKHPTRTLIEMFEREPSPPQSQSQSRSSLNTRKFLPSMAKLNHFRCSTHTGHYSYSAVKSVFSDCRASQFRRICCCREIAQVLFPYPITTQRQLIIHILVRRIEKIAQKFVRKQMTSSQTHDNKQKQSQKQRRMKPVSNSIKSKSKSTGNTNNNT